MSGDRTCLKCNVTKDVSEFGRNARAKSGLQTQCKSCRAAAAMKDYHANIDARKATRRKWNAANRDKKREQSRVWFAANPERSKASAAEWRKRNPQRQRELVRESMSRRRARLKGCVAYKVTRKDVTRILRQGCAVPDCTSLNLHVDHIIPIARGGSHGIGNLQALCRFHNISKSDRLWIEYRVYMNRQNSITK